MHRASCIASGEGEGGDGILGVEGGERYVCAGESRGLIAVIHRNGGGSLRDVVVEGVRAAGVHLRPRCRSGVTAAGP